MRIAIEATGCDKGFEVVLEGSRIALSKDRNLELILVAGKDKLPKKYSDLKEIDGVALEPADYTYDSNRPKSEQLQSSIYRMMELHKKGEVDAIIAPGDTRGSVVSAVRVLGLIENILSPAIATHWPRTNVLVDSGANVTEFGMKPENLLQFAILGKVYSENYVGVESPLIGLLNIGNEDTKGPKFIRRGRKLLSKLDGKYNLSKDYFEPDVFGELDGGRVVVIGGFTGNIGLKFSETTLAFFYEYLGREVRNRSFFRKLCAKIGLAIPLAHLKKDLNYESYAAAPLLGVNGNVMISHGRSNAQAIYNAIKITKQYLECNINDKLKEEINRYGKL